MDTRNSWRTAGLLLVLAFGICQSTVGQQVRVVNMIPNALSAETARDAEPNLTVNPLHSNQIMASTFTPDPMGTQNLPLFLSTDGGSSWSLTTPAVIPGTSGTCVSVVCDITLRFAATSDRLYVSDLNPVGGTSRLDVWQFTNPTTGGIASASLEQRPGNLAGFADQPYVEASTDSGSQDHVVVAVNDLMAASGMTATFDHTANATPPPPAGFSSSVLEARATTGQDAPSVRAAIHPSGVIYGVFYGMRSGGREVVVVRDDSWGAGATPFQALKDGDTLPGVRVATNLSEPGMLGTQRVGSQCAIAVDPNDNQTVYIVFADGTSSANYTLHVRKSTKGGASLSWSGDLTAVSPATNPGIAVNALGQVGFMFQKLVSGKWETHFIRSTDGGTTWPMDVLLANVPDAAGSYAGANPIGDYLSLGSVGRGFYGIFSANNTPDPANFHAGTVFQRKHDFSTKKLLDLSNNAVPVSIDPFFVEIQPSICEVIPGICNICKLRPGACYGIYDPWWKLKCPMCGIIIFVNPGDEFTHIPVTVLDTRGRKVGVLQRLEKPLVEGGVSYTHRIALRPREAVGYIMKAEVAEGQKVLGPFNPTYSVKTVEPPKTTR
jgi:hypothetical protein